MKRQIFCLLSIGVILIFFSQLANALSETDRTVIYKVTHHTKAGDLESYMAYSIVAQTESGYWLQRTAFMSPDSQPLSITQTLLNDFSHEPLRYIMHRPARMNRPANVIDLPLEKMGKDEILPTPLTDAFADGGRVQSAAGMFEVKYGQIGEVMLWLSRDVPVLGVLKAETPEWTMELFRIDETVVDLLPQKPNKGGIVYLKDE